MPGLVEHWTASMADDAAAYAPSDAIACPSCGGTTWIVPATVEVELTWDSTVPWSEEPNTSITAVRVVRERGNDGHEWIYPVHGEGDLHCAACGEQLLDWKRMEPDDDGRPDEAFARYHDERRPAWDLAHGWINSSELPEPNVWTSPSSPPEPEE